MDENTDTNINKNSFGIQSPVCTEWDKCIGWLTLKVVCNPLLAQPLSPKMQSGNWKKKRLELTSQVMFMAEFILFHCFKE